MNELEKKFSNVLIVQGNTYIQVKSEVFEYENKSKGAEQPQDLQSINMPQG